jgi:oxygen-independent coproporphyrinogen-3 oxidase
MYEMAEDYLAHKGFQQYEISNWASCRSDGLDSRCQHNLHTWQYHPYFGFGAGASGFIGNSRTSNIKPVYAYIQKIKEMNTPWPGAESTTEIEVWDQMQEMMMIGLRLTSVGVSDNNFKQRFNVSLFEVFARQIQYLLKTGLVEIIEKDGKSLRLTQQGRLLGNQVFMNLSVIRSLRDQLIYSYLCSITNVAHFIDRGSRG